MSELQTQKVSLEVLERQGRGRREESNEEEEEVEQAVYGCRCILVCGLLRQAMSCVDAVRE
jgi:hypothetical protein